MNKKLITKTTDSRLHKIPVPIIGLTGGIATGKSTVSQLLAKRGCPIICADSLVKEVYKSEKTLTHLNNKYPDILSDHVVDFKKLREKFFSDTSIQQDIENLIYSQMPDMFWHFYKALGKVDYLIYDVPLLFEKELDKLVDYKVTVYASRSLQLERLVKRDKIDESLANEILNKQLDIEKKKKLSDAFIDNSKDLTSLESNISKFLARILTD